MAATSRPSGRGPHDACFSPAGDIFVAVWASTGRVTKLEKIA
jgi:hypothetical protein